MISGTETSEVVSDGHIGTNHPFFICWSTPVEEIVLFYSKRKARYCIVSVMCQQSIVMADAANRWAEYVHLG